MPGFQPFEPLPLLNPRLLQPLRQLVILLREVLHRESADVDVKLVAVSLRQSREGHAVPLGRRLEELVIVLVGDGEVVYGLDMWRVPDALHGGDEPLGPRVEKVHGLRTAVLLTPALRLLVFFRREAGSLAETDEP